MTVLGLCVLFTQVLSYVSALCPLPAIPHGKVKLTTEAHTGQRAVIVCDTGYKLSNPSSITCSATGIWIASFGQQDIPKCIVSGKCSLPLIQHGKVLNPSGDANQGSGAWTETQVVCNEGYKLRGTPFIDCKDGIWSTAYGSEENFPVCVGTWKSCPSISNADVDYSWRSSKVTIHCKSGYVMDINSPAVLKCINGQWEGAVPTCGKSCPSVSTIANADVDYSWGSSKVTIHCKSGYVMDINSPAVLKCINGQWEGAVPTCGKSCPSVSTIANTDVDYSWGSSKVTIHCKSGYVMDINSPAVLKCINGQWEGAVPTCVQVKPCPQPPELPFASVQYGKANPVEGSKVIYHCHSGYTMDDPSLSHLTCVNGEWPGKLPTCMITILCNTPEDIPNGRWTPVSRSHPHTYEVNTKIQYDCNPGFRTLGESLMWCQEDKSWSHTPPQCIPNSDLSIYCASPPNLRHGECTCEGHDQNYCAPFTPGMRWLCHCEDGYALEEPLGALTCTSNGQWNHDMPACIAIDTEISSDITPSSQGTHISTLAIVVATACSVLGVLLLVMVAVIFRRHKPSPRLYHPTPAPPPYTRVHSSSVDEHDRVALIAYAEGRQITLPTYEEVTRGARSTGTTQGTTGVTNINEVGLQQYRPLPPVPPILRGTAPSSHSTSDNNNRHSTATTSTVHNRDGVSEVFGSLDTVNVSISDASTAGTMETVDSGASNPSLASRRANAGSLGSSNGSLANDDAPLLESSHDGRIMSTSSEPLPEEDKED